MWFLFKIAYFHYYYLYLIIRVHNNHGKQNKLCSNFVLLYYKYLYNNYEFNTAL